MKKFNFEYSDLTNTEYVKLCNILIKNQICYAKHRNDVGKISTPFRIRIKETLPEYTAYLNSDTDIMDSSSPNHIPSVP